MKTFIILAVINLLVFITLGPVGILTSAYTIYYYATQRGKKLVKAYLFMISLQSGISISEANERIRNANQECLEMMAPAAKNFADMLFNGSQMTLINKAISEGMEGGGWADRLWANAKKNEKINMEARITANKEGVIRAKESFLPFAKITNDKVSELRDAAVSSEMDDYERLLFMRYLVEANEAAMHRFGVDKGLWDAINIGFISGLTGMAEGIVTDIVLSFQIPPLRACTTNELLDDYKGAGRRAYEEWVIYGDDTAIERAELLWKEGCKYRKIRDELAPLGIFENEGKGYEFN